MGYFFDYRKLKKFQPLYVRMTLVRILFATLIQKQILSELQRAVKTLVFLKRMKGGKEFQNNRYINIMIISFQIVNPIVVCFVSILYLAQEGEFFGMIKGYVALGFILNIDDMFSEIFPKMCKAVPNQLNDDERLVMSMDNNSNKRVLKRCFRRRNICKPSIWCSTLFDLIVNFWVWFLTNFVILFFNYFAAQAAAIIQVLIYTVVRRWELY